MSANSFNHPAFECEENTRHDRVSKNVRMGQSKKADRKARRQEEYRFAHIQPTRFESSAANVAAM
jgi:hypothetical protein